MPRGFALDQIETPMRELRGAPAPLAGQSPLAGATTDLNTYVGQRTENKNNCIYSAKH